MDVLTTVGVGGQNRYLYEEHAIIEIFQCAGLIF